MTLKEATQILATLKAAYPHSFRDATEDDALATAKLWARLFENERYSDVDAAVLALIATRTVGYSPTVGEVKEMLQSLRAEESLTEQEAWALVSEACKNGLYGYAEEFKKLPDSVQRAVGRPEQLHEWAKLDVDSLQSVVASNFMRGFRARQAIEKERALLPVSLQRQLTAAPGLRRIGGGDEPV